MREDARVVIIGAGIVGCSAAYHLARLGWRDIVVVDQGPLFSTGGSTAHAPGLVFQLNASRTVTHLAMASVRLFSEQSLDGQPSFYGVGSLEVATTPQRWQELKRKQGHALSWGLPAELIGPHEVKRLVPLMRTDHLYGALYVPSDGVPKAVRAGEAMARAAQALGAAEFHGRTEVLDVEVAQGRVRAVLTSQGRIRTETILLCAGIWGPRIGRMAGVHIPLTPMQHLYARTAPLPELAGETREVVHPVVRHQDRAMYFRQQDARYGVGSYRHEPLLVDADEIPRHEQAGDVPSVLPFTPAHFAASQADAVELFPCLAGVPLEYGINGMFSFTPDGQSLLGESPDVRGFWVAEAVWITHAGGVGQVMAEWMVEGRPSLDLREADLNRFHPFATTPSYVRIRGAQQYREVYDIIHPLQQMEQPRNLRLSPFHPRLRELGAVFFESAGWERAQWLSANEPLLARYEVPRRSGWAAEYWSPIIGAEHLATREGVALFDLSAFTKLEVSGPGALDFLQRLAANQMDRPLGKVTYTALLDQAGGIQCDLTVTRLGPTRFMVVTGSAGTRDLAWLRLHQPQDGSVVIQDLTSAYCCLGLWGPCARDVLQSVSADDLSNEALPYLTARRISVGVVPVLAVRVSYAGELGWELYAAGEFGLALWDALWAAGTSRGIVAAGAGAFDSLRLEKGYRLWGSDIHAEYNPYEAALGFAVRLDKGDFNGRAALAAIHERGPERRLSALVFDDPSVIVMGKEPILHHDNVRGYVTSANYGYSVGQSIAYGYLPAALAVPGTRVQVQYFGQRHDARVAAEPLFDAQGTRLRC